MEHRSVLCDVDSIDRQGWHLSDHDSVKGRYEGEFNAWVDWRKVMGYLRKELAMDKDMRESSNLISLSLMLVISTRGSSLKAAARVSLAMMAVDMVTAI